MTYSHKSVGNHIMTPATIATTTARTKNVSNGGSGGGDSKKRALSPITPPPPICAHSNSIASSTNHSHHVLSTSPPGFMSSGASVSSNCSNSSNTSSLGSNGNGSGGGFYATRCRIRNNGQQQPQRQSPQQLYGVGGGSYNNNKCNYQQRQSSGGILISGSAQKHPRDLSRSPSSQPRRQSPAVILGSGASIVCSSGGGSGRKYRAKLATNPNPLTSAAGGGKISPTHPLIPTALTHFAGSKCFDAPSPTALPKPPQHWTLIEAKIGEKVNSCAGPGLHSVTNARKPTMHAVDAHTCGGHVVKTSKRNLLDDFDTHNLKLLLNVHS